MQTTPYSSPGTVFSDTKSEILTGSPLPGAPNRGGVYSHQRFSIHLLLYPTSVSTAADRPTRRRGSTHAKYSVSHHMVFKPFLLLGLAGEYRSWRWVWSTVVRRPSGVYDTHGWTKLTAPEKISRSRDMVGAHLNLNGSCDIPTPLSGMVAIHGLALATINQVKPWSIIWCCLGDIMFSRFGTIPTCDRQTGRHTMTAYTVLP